MKKQSVMLLAVALLSAPCALAAEYPTQVYDATYQMTNPQGKSEMRMASDGKGHMLTETSTHGQQFKTIIDYPARTAITLIEAGKMAMKNNLPPASAYISTEDSVKKYSGKPLGAKVVNGHPCHGFEYTNAGVKSQTWIGDDCKIMVQSVSDTAGGKVVMDLKSVSGAPAADTFAVPAGYKLITQ